MLDTNKANESVWMVPPAFVSTSECHQVNVIRGHEIKKVKILNFGIGVF